MVLDQNKKVIRQRPQARALARRVRGRRGVSADLAPPAGAELEAPLSMRLVEYLKHHLDAGETHYTTRPGMVELRRRVADELAGLGGPARAPNGVLITAGEGEALFASLLGLGHGAGDRGRLAGAWQPHMQLLEVLGVTAAESGTDKAPEDGAAAADAGTEERELEAWRLLPPPGGSVAASSVGESAESGLEASAAGSAAASEDDASQGGGAPGGPDAVHEPPESDQTTDRPVRVVCLGDVFGTDPGELPDLNLDAVYVGNLDGLPEMPTFRLGFVAGPPDLIKRIMVWKQAFSICSAAPSQRAALYAFHQRAEADPGASP